MQPPARHDASPAAAGARSARLLTLAQRAGLTSAAAGRALRHQPAEQGGVGRQLVRGMAQHPAQGADRRGHLAAPPWVGHDGVAAAAMTVARVGAAGSRNGLRCIGIVLVVDRSVSVMTGDDSSCHS